MNQPLARGTGQLDEEAELVRLAKQRSRDAWTTIYEQNHPKLFRYVLARVGDRPLAEDLTASVFLEALKSIDSYSSRGRPLLAWLYSIARNVVNYHHRSAFRKNAVRGLLSASGQLLSQVVSRRRGPGGLPEDVPASQQAADEANPDSAVERWDLRDAINRLSADQREVIVLRYFMGLTTPETARVLGKHDRAVYSLQTRAIKALRRHLR